LSLPKKIHTNKNNKKEAQLSNLTNIDHWLLFVLGVLSFVSASIWYYIFY